MGAAFVLALAAAQAAAPAAPMTLQQRFDAAGAAAQDGHCKEALPQLDSLASDKRIAGRPVAAAVVAMHKGSCLIRIGSAEAGEPVLRGSLPVLEKQGSEFALDLRKARLLLGAAAAARFDYPAARSDFEAALALSGEGALRIMPLLGLSRIALFDRDGVAVRHAEEALRVATAALSKKGIDRKEMSVVRTQYARALLNAGRASEAYRELKTGLAESGGLTSTVRANDIATRSDLAIAAHLVRDEQAARKYLAYTGAGRMADTPFGRAAEMEPPFCGTAGLKPDDMAIVEFSLADDGHVEEVMPIYTTAGRDAATEFARAVKGWSWRAEDVAKIPPLMRYTTRVEMRCARGAPRASLRKPLLDAIREWGVSKGAEVVEPGDRSDAVLLPLQRAALGRAKARGDQASVFMSAFALAQNQVLPPKEYGPLILEAAAAARAAGAPAIVRAGIEPLAIAGGDDRKKYRAAMRATLADPAVAADPLAAATLRMSIAERQYGLKEPEDAPALLQAVIDQPGLPPQHPLKVAALLQLANLRAAKGDYQSARALFDRTGLTEEQCALIEPTPVARNTPGSSSDYPMAALQMGFEGWVRTEYDIAANGTTVTPRAVVAYPPFVFNDAAMGLVGLQRFTSSYRPSNDLACTASGRSVVFSMP